MSVIGLRRYIMHDLLLDNLCSLSRQELLQFSHFSIKCLGFYDYAFSACSLFNVLCFELRVAVFRKYYA